MGSKKDSHAVTMPLEVPYNDEAAETRPYCSLMILQQGVFRETATKGTPCWHACRLGPPHLDDLGFD